jgi:phosphoserine phosphatase RsbU/P
MSPACRVPKSHEPAAGSAREGWSGEVAIAPATWTRRDEQLRDLKAITDAALGRLDPDELLLALLERVKKIVDADTTTVLLLDSEGRLLIARASLGLEEEVRQGVRIPFGVGFAGRIAAERKPVMIDRVDSSTVTNPILWEHGVRVMLGVPLLAGDDTVGVLHVGRCRSIPFTLEDAEILSVAAERMAAAIQAEQRREAQAAASLLIDNLRPGLPPACRGLDFATRYLPAERGGAGGDWYDVFLAEGGGLWLIVGDVAGHGLGAAVVMARVQSTLRAFASVADSPEAALEATHRAMLRFDPGVMATAVCALVEPPYRELRIATAGHPPPILSRPTGPAEIASLAAEPPLGVLPHRRRSSRAVGFPDGSTIVFYSDGLVQRRREPLDDSLGRLREVVGPDDAETVCRRVIRELVGPEEREDDVAVLAVHAVA